MNLDGILLLNKPAGITSHDVVDFVRRRFSMQKVGHGGTLDPLATGLLIVMLGRATKLSQKIIGLDKEYIAEMSLGFSTTTGDLAGEISEKSKGEDYLKLAKQEIEKVFSSFIGEIDQVPPMFSAVKYKGKRLYTLARKGIKIKMQPRKVKIYSLDISEICLPKITFKTRCSRGLYIRQLCIDIGLGLGYPAHLSRMVRIRIGKFSLDDASKLDNILNEVDSEKHVIPIEAALRVIRDDSVKRK